MGSAQVQGALWGAAPEDWAELQEPTGESLFEATFDALGVGNGTRLLDVGCGSGFALTLAAKRGATISGFDASEGLLGITRSRLPDADIRQGDLETLPYADNTFDTVTAFNSVQYATDPVRGLREIKRVADPGARVAVATWGNPDRCEQRMIIAAVGALLSPPPAPGAGGPFAMAAPGALEALVESAGLNAERTFEVAGPWVYPDIATARRANLSAGPIRTVINKVGLDAVDAALVPALDQFVQSDGSVRIENVFKVVTARA